MKKPGPGCPDYTPAWKGLHRVLIKALWESESRREVLPACLSTSAHSTLLLLSSLGFGLLPFAPFLAALHFPFPHLFTRSAPSHQSAWASTTSSKRPALVLLRSPAAAPTHTPQPSLSHHLFPLGCICHHLTLPCLFTCMVPIVCFPQIKSNLRQVRDFEPCVHPSIFNVENRLGTDYLCQ